MFKQDYRLYNGTKQRYWAGYNLLFIKKGSRYDELHPWQNVASKNRYVKLPLFSNEYLCSYGFTIECVHKICCSP